MVLSRRWLMLRLLLLLVRVVLLTVMWSLHAAAAEMRRLMLVLLVPLQVLVLYVAARGAWGWRSSPQPSSVALHVVHSFV